MTELHPDGPHNAEYTGRLGDALAETVRVLNHATMPGAGGLEHPADAHRLIGDLYTTLGRMPQLFRQIAVFLQARQETGGLRDVEGRDTAALVADASMRLTGAAYIAEQAEHCLQAAQNDVAGLATDNPHE